MIIDKHDMPCTLGRTKTSCSNHTRASIGHSTATLPPTGEQIVTPGRAQPIQGLPRATYGLPAIHGHENGHTGTCTTTQGLLLATYGNTPHACTILVARGLAQNIQWLSLATLGYPATPGPHIDQTKPAHAPKGLSLATQSHSARHGPTVGHKKDLLKPHTYHWPLTAFLPHTGTVLVTQGLFKLYSGCRWLPSASLLHLAIQGPARPPWGLSLATHGRCVKHGNHTGHTRTCTSHTGAVTGHPGLSAIHGHSIGHARTC